MWQEYAIEPAALVRSLKEFNTFHAGLGWEHGRLLAKFPGDYKRLVHEALTASPEQEIKRATMINKLTELFNKSLVSSKRDAPAGDNWGTKASIAHANVPFHALITLMAATGAISLDDFDPSATPWTCPSDIIVPRTSQSLASAAQRIFNHVAHVVIVDPHFAPQRAHVSKVLEAYLDSRDHPAGSEFRLHIHAGRAVLGRGQNQPEYSNAELEAAVRNKISAMLRSGQSVTLFIWDEILNGERLHDRYILCRHGGLSIQGGVDSGPATETTTLARVSPTTAQEIISRFDRSISNTPSRIYNLVHRFEIQ